MIRRPLAPRRSQRTQAAARSVIVLGLLATALGVLAGPVAAADAPTMTARVLVGGHARIGSWVAISVHLHNDGPAVAGELRVASGTQGETRFGIAVDLPTQSDKTYVLYAQPPTFGTQLEVLLVEGDRTIASVKARFTSHEASQLIVAVIAEHPERIVAGLDLPPNFAQVAPQVVNLAPEDLPERLEAWSAIDRIIWQDIDAGRLTTAQIDALRGWTAAGGRIVIAGGTAGPKSLAAFPDVLLPYRPAATTDAPPASLVGLLGELPAGATTLPALSGELIDGRILASVGGRVVAAERPYGSGSVSLLGFDPAADWIATSDAAANLWRRLLPPRSTSGLAFLDDSMLVSAVQQLPALSLPPIGSLIVLLGAYILLIGPLNYLVLKRLDRREWAWLTMPVLIVAFAIGAYAIGGALRGTELIVNEVAVVRGAAGATDGAAQVYLGIFSPSRGTYQVRVPGGPLLSTPLNAAMFGGGGTTASLDALQGDPAEVRDLAVGFGTLRAIKAETSVAVPLIQADLRLVDGRLKGTIRNASNRVLERPAVVLGGTVAVLADLQPGAEASVDAIVESAAFGMSLSDRIIGPIFGGDGGVTADVAQAYVRHNVIDQLTYDPFFGSTNLLSADGPVVLAWGTGDLIGVEVSGQTPTHVGNILYFVPAGLTVRGPTTFGADLIRTTTVASDAALFTKDPRTMSFGRGSATVAYRPMAFDGRITGTRLTIGLNFGEPGLTNAPTTVEPLASAPPPCPDPPTAACNVAVDGLPEVEVFDIDAQVWRRLPHFTSGTSYAVAGPARFIDPASGTVLVRYVNDRTDPVGFGMDVTISGTIE